METTRRFPRTLREAYPNHYPEWIEKHNTHTDSPDFWVMLVCAFAAGFLAAMMYAGA